MQEIGNKYYISGIIYFLFCFFFSHFLGNAIWSQEKIHLPSFTAKEKKIIQKCNPLNYCVDPHFMPFEQINKDGEHEGIFADFLDLIQRKTGLKFALIQTENYKESREKFAKGDCDFIAGDSVRTKGPFATTMAYFSSYNCFVVRKEEKIKNISEVGRKRVGYIKGIDVAFLIKEHGKLNFVPASSTLDGLKKVANGELYIFTDVFASVAYGIEKSGIVSLKIIGNTNKKMLFGIHIKNEFKELVPIINKAIHSITNEERQKITKRWLNIAVEKKVDYSILWKTLLVLAVIFSIFCYRQIILSSMNKKLTISKNEAEEARKTAEMANQAKSVFLANMSHELRTPLNAILGYTQLFKRNQDLMIEHAKAIHTIHHSGEYLLLLINDILDLSKVEAGKIELQPTPIDMSYFLETLVEMTRVQAMLKNIAFHFSSSPDLPLYIKVDEKRLRQILLNLLSNAIKFTDKGKVHFKVEHISLQTETRIHRILFQVEDSGIGISPQNIERIFLPFEQVDKKYSQKTGTGLGLAISQRLVHLMGGTLQVKNANDKGSAFWFELDLPEASSPIAGTKTQKQIISDYRGKRRKIFIIDDISENRDVLKELLVSLHFEVEEANNGHDALKKIDLFRPDLILLDWVMPIMDGKECTHQIRKNANFTTIPIVAVSSSTFPQMQQDILVAGCSDFIAKPVQVYKLLDCLQKHLHLEWIYKEYEEIPAKEIKTPVDILPRKELETLLNLVQQQNISEIKKHINRLKKQDLCFGDFLIEIDQQLEQYQFKKMVALIELYLQKM